MELKNPYFTPWTDVERGNVAFYPIRLGYASTVQKILGDKVERMVGRTKLASAYSSAGKLTPARFAPAAQK